jgi:hypothetical protein
MYATVAAMRLSARPPIPDMLTMTFRQSESRICGQGTSNWRSNTHACDYFCLFWGLIVLQTPSWAGRLRSKIGVSYQNNRKGLL